MVAELRPTGDSRAGAPRTRGSRPATSARPTGIYLRRTEIADSVGIGAVAPASLAGIFSPDNIVAQM